MIKHISFDLWLTLIKSNPQFKQRRADLIAEVYNPKNLSATQVLRQLHAVDCVCNRYNEMNDCKITSETMYHRVLMKIGNDPEILTKDYLNDLQSKIAQLLEKYPPVLLNENILSILKKLKLQGTTLNISSNTGYLEADDLVKPLEIMGISKHIDFCIFSDQINTSKPSPVFFKKITDKVKLLKNEVLHIGDNLKADYHGAIKFGFQALHIINQEYTFHDIQQAMQQN